MRIDRKGDYWHRVEQLTPFLATVVLAGVTAFSSYNLSHQQLLFTIEQSNRERAERQVQLERENRDKDRQYQLSRVDKLISIENLLKSPSRPERLEALAMLISLGDTDVAARSIAVLEDSDSLQSLLLDSADIGDNKLAEFVLEVGTNPNTRDKEGRTALIRASVKNRPSIIKILLNHKADVELPGWKGETPLMAAVRSGSFDAVDSLLNCGAKVDTEEVDGFPAFLYLFPIQADGAFGHVNVGFDITLNYRSKFRLDIAQRLVNAGVNVNTLTFYSDPLLMSAPLLGGVETLKGLISLGADVNTRDHQQETILMHCCATANVQEVQALLDCHADTAATDGFGNTALMYSASELGGRNGNFRMQQKENLDRAKIFSMLPHSILELHQKDGYGNALIVHAVRGGFTEIVAQLLTLKVPITTRTSDGYSLLAEAMLNCKFETALFLISSGADVNEMLKGTRSVLMLAIYETRPSLLRAVDGGNYYNDMQASQNLIKSIVEKRVNINFQNADGWTALMESVDDDHVWAAELLVEAGADKNLRNDQGFSARDMALKRNNSEMLSLLH